MPPDLQMAVVPGRLLKVLLLGLMVVAGVAVAVDKEDSSPPPGISQKGLREDGVLVDELPGMSPLPIEQYAALMERKGSDKKKALIGLQIISTSALAVVLATGLVTLVGAARRRHVSSGEEPEPRGRQLTVGISLVVIAVAIAVPMSNHYDARREAIDVATKEAIEKHRRIMEERERLQAKRRRPLLRRIDALAGLRQWSASRIVWGPFLAALPEHIEPEVQLLSFSTVFDPSSPEGRVRDGKVLIMGKARGEKSIVRFANVLRTKEPFRTTLTSNRIDRVIQDPDPNASRGDLKFSLVAKCRSRNIDRTVNRSLGFDKQPAIERQIRWIPEKHILHPVLGIRHLIPATEIVKRQAAGCGVKTVSTSDGGILRFPAVEGSTLPCDLDIYTCTIDLQGDFRQLTSLIMALEDGNPYLHVLRVSIIAHKSGPETHRSVLLVAWPIWKKHLQGGKFLWASGMDTERPAWETVVKPRPTDIQKGLADSRDPFRPADWKPTLVREWERVRKMIQLVGVAGRGDDRTAAVKLKGCEGKIPVKTGEILDIRHDGLHYKWRVTSISQDGLGLQPVSATPLP